MEKIIPIQMGLFKGGDKADILGLSSPGIAGSIFLHLRDRLKVGRRSLKAKILVRFQVPQPIFKRKNRVETSTLSTNDIFMLLWGN